MDRRIGGLRDALVGGGGEEYVRRFHADLEFVEVVVLKDANVLESRFDHRLGTWLAVFLQQAPFQASRVHSDTDRATVILGRRDHLSDADGVADVSGIDPQAGGPCLGSLDGAPVMEMNVRDDRRGAFRDDLPQRRSRRLVWRRNPHDFGAGIDATQNLLHGRRDIRGVGVRHGLDRDRGVAADRDGTDANLPRFAAAYLAPGAYVVQRHGSGLVGM